MVGKLLLDTGALVSLLDRSQPLHEPCAACLGAWVGPVVSTEAVLTEATQLLGRVHRGRETCLDFVLRGGAVVVPSTRESLARCRELIETYADLPMDFADATLVTLAEELDTHLVIHFPARDDRAGACGRLTHGSFSARSVRDFHAR